MSLTKLLAMRGSSTLTINPNHNFTDNTARDTYFTANPSEKTEGIFIAVGAGFQQLVSGVWVDRTALVKGPKGDSPTTAPYTVGVGGINAYQVVFISSANTILAGNSANVTHAGRIVGIALETAISGASVAVQQLGAVVNPAWDLTAGDIYYLDNGGNITNVAPVVGFSQKIGIAQNAISLFLQIGSPITLA